ncbi:hypothetical protein [Streptomyces sp. NBC_01751]|uniref:hypothetical protein n=1 Tax=Streptomyces sp. NBC_01751 TaxID=2975929 RepID=UPI002DDC2BE8|nr:hypothetical protein [Streptomyces sp. NBC_01751]WSD23349.1 hypothetical protein OHA26_07595 [Streptomyces sp. NBC_01751]
MNAFDPSKNTRSMNFAALDGRTITVRPLWDAGLGRNVVELDVNGTAVSLPNSQVPAFVDAVTIAAFVGELENAGRDNPTPAAQ